MTTDAYRVELDGGRFVWWAPQGYNLKDSTNEPNTSALLPLLLKLLGPFTPEEML